MRGVRHGIAPDATPVSGAPAVEGARGAPLPMSFSLRSRRSRFFFSASLSGLVLVSVGAWASNVVFGDNLHVVVPGRLYRSAQLTVDKLDEVIEENGIASVLSLRKCDPASKELSMEMEHLGRIGVPHDNVKLRVSALPTPEALAQLVERFDAGPYPMLVHCQHGADRTGLAVTIWLVLYDGRSVEEARELALSWRTGHFGLGAARAIDDFFDLYSTTSHGQDLRSWMRDTYPRVFETAHPPGPAGPTRGQRSSRCLRDQNPGNADGNAV